MRRITRPNSVFAPLETLFFALFLPSFTLLSRKKNVPQALNIDQEAPSIPCFPKSEFFRASAIHYV